MKVGDLVSVRNHPEHLGVITELSELESGLDGWIAISWFTDCDSGMSEYKIPLSSAKHIEVLQ